MKFWRLVVRDLTLVAFIFFVIPTLLLVLLGTKEAILPIILYFQLLLLLAQIELNVKHHALFSAQYEPVFTVSRAPSGTEVRAKELILIQNNSTNIAYHLAVARVLDGEGRPIAPDLWKQKIHSFFISSLAPNETKPLCEVDLDVLRSDWSIEAIYYNRLGELNDLHLRFFDGDILIIPHLLRTRGLFSRLSTSIVMYYHLWRWRKYSRVASTVSKDAHRTST
jgi:hypothetical protein